MLVDIEAAGRVCVSVLKGMEEYAGFTKIWLRHLEDAVNAL
jgi:hypothetical protein